MHHYLCVPGDRVQHVLLRVLLGGEGRTHGGPLRHGGSQGAGHWHQGQLHTVSKVLVSYTLLANFGGFHCI